MDFMLGCNYWASNAGTDMWKDWKPETVEDDLNILSIHGIKYLRVFPNWRDFQPVIPMMSGCGSLMEYRLENDIVPKNIYYIDEIMMKRFEKFCDICDKYNIKLIVGLLTGWMSGRLFIPAALYGKNLYTDSTALLLEQKFVTGFVQHFKNCKTIVAWDLGNECNCMSKTNNRNDAANWTYIISNAIKANDNTRPIVSGMHSLGMEKEPWTIQDQAECTDILTTHPYPYWVKYADFDEISSYRTAIHATCETKLYSDIGNKPCLVEEIGTMGPMICSDENAADFIRCNLFSNYANNAMGVMWWCANEQTNLKNAPYTWNMVEVELGLIDAKRKPKPVLKEIKKFDATIKNTGFDIQKPMDDIVCILSKSQDQWGIAYMSYCLAKQNDINLKFTYCDKEIPDSNIYMLPSISGPLVMPAENYAILKDKVYNGAALYLSIDDGIISDFNNFAGVKVLDSSITMENNGTINLDGETIAFTRSRRYRIDADRANVLAYDNNGIPAITKYSYGKGKVLYVNFPLEKMLLSESEAFDTNRYLIYKRLFEDVLNNKKVRSDNKYIAVTEHIKGNNIYCIAINYSNSIQKTNFVMNGYKIDQLFYGSLSEIKPFDATVFSIKIL